MAHVKRRRLANGKSAYLVRSRDPAGKERSRQFTRKADAEGFLHSTAVAKRDGSWLDPSRAKMRLRDWVVLCEPSTVNLSPSTKARQDGIVRGHIVPRVGDLPLARIENADVQAWVAELSARGLAPATVKKVRAPIGTALSKLRGVKRNAAPLSSGTTRSRSTVSLLGSVSGLAQRLTRGRRVDNSPSSAPSSVALALGLRELGFGRCGVVVRVHERPVAVGGLLA